MPQVGNHAVRGAELPIEVPQLAAGIPKEQDTSQPVIRAA
jgi:hypothetical protein